MIQHVKIDHHTHDAVMAAAREAGISYNAMLEMIVADWATAHERQRRGRAELQDAIGVIPGGD